MINPTNRIATQFYESLISSSGILARNEKRGELASIKPTDSPLELSSVII